MSIKREIDSITSATSKPSPEDDAKRVEAITDELHAILSRQSWPGIALSLCLVGDKVEALGHTYLSMEDHAKILLNAKITGVRLLESAQILGEGD